MAMNRRADYENAKVENFKVIEEWRLDQWIRVKCSPGSYSQGQLPSQLDPEVVLAFRALLAKSANPQNYIGYHLRELYRACRDFRLLSCLADSIPGHTAGQIYPYLQAARSVIDEIRDEAAVDSLAEQIAELRKQAKTDVDRRAFDLLEAMTERRAAELRNQPGPHVDKAVAALQRACKRQWSPGEATADGRFPRRRWAAFPRKNWPPNNCGNWRPFTTTPSPIRSSGSTWPAIGPRPCGATSAASRPSICWKRRSIATRPPGMRPRSAHSLFSTITSPISINWAATPSGRKI